LKNILYFSRQKGLNCTKKPPESAPGAFVSGIVTALISTPLWNIGGIRNAKAEHILQKINVAPKNSMAVGLGIKLRF